MTIVIVRTGFGGDYYVAATGNDTTGNGSALYPWRTIAYALSVIEGSINNPHVIHVAPGTYDSIHTGEKFPLQLKSYITLQGSGDSITILDGLRKKRIIQIDSVISVTVDGFTITRGKGRSVEKDNFGGGIRIRASSFITISNNIITQNWSGSTVGSGAAGGGIDAENSSYLLITKNKIISNSASADNSGGGGIYIWSQNCIVSYNLVKSNWVFGLFWGAGGGLESLSNSIIRNNVFEGNISDCCGGGISCARSELIIRNIIRSDTAGTEFAGFGGGVLIDSPFDNPIVGGGVGNGNIIYDNISMDDGYLPIYKGKGYQLANRSSNTVNARYNYFGDETDPHDTLQVYGKFFIEPYMTVPIVFDTSNLVVVPSPINFDTVAVGSSKTMDITFFNVINSLYDSIRIDNIFCQNSQIEISQHALMLTPAGKYVIGITLSPKSTGYFSDSLLLETNIGEYNIRIEGLIIDSTASAVTEESSLPMEYSLSQSHPNPFNPSTQITYSIPKTIDVTLKVYDVIGREIAVLVNERKPAGEYSVTWDAVGIPTGVYFYRIVAGEYIETKKMVVIR